MEKEIIVALIGFLAGVVATWLAGGLSRRLKISEFRQAWINDLRQDVADYLGKSRRSFKAYADGEEKWKQFTIRNEASVIYYRIRMRINPLPSRNKTEDDEFLAILGNLHDPEIVAPVVAESHWGTLSEEAIERTRRILKREWETTKRLFWFWRP